MQTAKDSDLNSGNSDTDSNPQDSGLWLMAL